MSDTIKLDYRVVETHETNATQIRETWWCVYEESYSTVTGRACGAKELMRTRSRSVAIKQVEIQRVLNKGKLLFPQRSPLERLLKREPTNTETLEAIKNLLKDALGIPADLVEKAIQSAMMPKVSTFKAKATAGPPEGIRAHIAPGGIPDGRREVKIGNVLPSRLTVE